MKSLWLVHGSGDSLAPIADTEELVRTIEGVGGHPGFDTLPERDHFILDVCERRDIYDWLSQPKR